MVREVKCEIRRKETAGRSQEGPGDDKRVEEFQTERRDRVRAHTHAHTYTHARTRMHTEDDEFLFTIKK